MGMSELKMFPPVIRSHEEMNGSDVWVPDLAGEAGAPEAADDPGDAVRIQELMGKGFAESPEEAAAFVLKIRETFEMSGKARSLIDGFQEAFGRVVAEAEAHLSELEGGMEGDFDDKAAIFREIAEGLAMNPDEDMLFDGRGSYAPSAARKFADFVGRHKAALVAVNVFVAMMRLGGSAVSSEGGHDGSGSVFGEASGMEWWSDTGNPEDFEEVNDLLQSSDYYSV